MSDSISRKGVSAWLYNMGHYKLADAVMDENRFPSEGRAHGEYTTEEVAEILATAFGDECACNCNDIDEWLPFVCKYVPTDDCPHPKDKHGCWIQYLVQYEARMKGADDE